MRSWRFKILTINGLQWCVFLPYAMKIVLFIYSTCWWRLLCSIIYSRVVFVDAFHNVRTLMSGGGRGRPSICHMENICNGQHSSLKKCVAVSSKCYIDKRYQLEFLPGLTVPASRAIYHNTKVFFYTRQAVMFFTVSHKKNVTSTGKV